MKKNLPHRSAIASWFLHWSTFVLVAMAFTMPFAQSIGRHFRMPIHFWHEFHITAGTLALGLIVIRLAGAGMQNRVVLARFSASPFAAALQFTLLVMLLLVAISGLLAFRQPVFGTKIRLFGVWALPDIRLLASAPSETFRLFHSALAYLFIGIVAVHIWMGVRHDPRRRQRPIWQKMWPR